MWVDVADVIASEDEAILDTLGTNLGLPMAMEHRAFSRLARL